MLRQDTKRSAAPIRENMSGDLLREETHAVISGEGATPKIGDRPFTETSTAKNDAHADAEYDKRNELYTDLLTYYISSNKKKAVWNGVYKCIFFCVTMLLLLVLIGVPVFVIVMIVQKEDANLMVDLAALASSLISVISAIVILPKIIAQHLFPTNEDEHMIELVKNMQVNDSKIRAGFRKNDSK